MLKIFKQQYYRVASFVLDSTLFENVFQQTNKQHKLESPQQGDVSAVLGSHLNLVLLPFHYGAAIWRIQVHCLVPGPHPIYPKKFQQVRS